MKPKRIAAMEANEEVRRHPLRSKRRKALGLLSAAGKRSGSRVELPMTVMTPKTEESREVLIWWIRCPNCDYSTHVADIGHEAITDGQHIFWKCDNCWSWIKKIVGKDTGRITAKGPKQDLNPYSGVTTRCDHCGRMVMVSPTFLLCTPCRKKYVRVITGLAVKGLVLFCFMCGRALALDASWCDRCGRNQEI